jgi:hypothetical protein
MSQFTADQLALQAHIEAANAKFVAECEASGATWYCTTVSDPAHWAEYGVFTIEQYERDSLISYISDAHKDAYGFRPRGYNYEGWTLEQLQEEADRMSEAVARAIQEEQERDARAVAEFEAQVQSNLDMGAADRDTAIRWILEAEGDLEVLWDDAGYACYIMGLPYSMEDVLRPVLNTMRNEAVEAA